MIVVLAAIAISYETNWPIGFFVGTFSALAYLLGRVCASLTVRPATAIAHDFPIAGAESDRS